MNSEAYHTYVRRCQTNISLGANQVYTALDVMAEHLVRTRESLNEALRKIRLELEARQASLLKPTVMQDDTGAEEKEEEQGRQQRRRISEFEHELDFCKDSVVTLSEKIGIVNVVRRVSKSIHASVTPCLDLFPSSVYEGAYASMSERHPWDDLALVCLNSSSLPVRVVLELIAKHFLHLNRFDLFNTLKEESHSLLLGTQESKIAEQGLSTIAEGLRARYPTGGRTEEEEKERLYNGSVYGLSISETSVREQLHSEGRAAAHSPTYSLVSDEMVEAYQQLHWIVESLKQGQVEPALQWLEDKQDDVLSWRAFEKGQSSRLLFALHEVQFLALLTSVAAKSTHSRSTVQSQNLSLQRQAFLILKYARRNLSTFLPQLRSDVSRLVGSLAYLGSNTSPYTTPEPLAQTFAWEHLAKDFQRRFCLIGTTVGRHGAQSDGKQKRRKNTRHEDEHNIKIRITGNDDDEPAVDFQHEQGLKDSVYLTNENLSQKGHLVRLPLENPLAVLVAAGMIACPQILALLKTLHSTQPRRIATTEIQKWTEEKKIPVDIDLGPPFHFHSIFICPICRSPDHDTLSGSVCRLPCGHVICRSCIAHLSDRTRRPGMKCPVCPKEVVQSDIQELVFDWIPSEAIGRQKIETPKHDKHDMIDMT